LLILPANELLRPQVVIGDTTPRRTTYPIGTPATDWRRGGRGWVGTFGNETKLDPARCYPAPAVVRSGTVELPAIDVFALLPGRNGDLESAEVRELFNNGDSAAVLVKTSVRGRELQDLFCWRGTRERETYGYFPSGSGAWMRIVDGQLKRLTVIRGRHVDVRLAGWEVDCRFSEDFEGYLEFNGSEWQIYADLALPRKTELLRMSVRSPDGHARLYRLGQRGRLLAADGTPTRYLSPGERYTIRVR